LLGNERFKNDQMRIKLKLLATTTSSSTTKALIQKKKAPEKKNKQLLNKLSFVVPTNVFLILVL
jgi:hypothetical protein